MPGVRERFKNAWNVFRDRDPTRDYHNAYDSYYAASATRPDRTYMSKNYLKTIVSVVITRIAVDCSQININHVRLDPETGKFKNIIRDSELNRVLSKEANIDQTGRELIYDAVFSMLDEGCAAIAPIDTDRDPNSSGNITIYTARVGRIREWFPNSLRLEAYNQISGRREEFIIDKSITAVIENPFYAVMNETNSTGQRLTNVLNQLDKCNREIQPGKMDIIIQVPYSIKSPAKRIEANNRRIDLEKQLTGSQYGIGYIDSTEKVIQLNRSLENNLWEQAKDLTQDLFNELGLTKEVLDGTADEQTMLNYYNQTITPIMTSITENIERKWLSRTAQTQGQAIRFFRDAFRLTPVNNIAEVADKFTRNEILTSNEVRGIIGYEPVDDKKANELRNANINHPDEALEAKAEAQLKEETDDVKEPKNIDKVIDKVGNKKVE